MASIVVNRNALREIIENMVDSFNDCACCPLSYDCKHEGDMSLQCVNDILFDYLEVRE